MVTKQLLKDEIDNIKEEYLDVLYRIIKTLGEPIKDPSQTNAVLDQDSDLKSDWHRFIKETYGSTADAELKR